MTLIQSLIAQGVRAYREPRAAAADVLALGVPRAALAPAMLLIITVSVLLDSFLSVMVVGIEEMRSPFQLLFLYAALLIGLSFAIATVGRFFGGAGTVADAVLLASFLQALLIPATLVQIMLILISPQLAMMFVLFIILFFIWLQTNFVAALHGFETLGRAFLVLLVSSLIIAVAAMPFLTPMRVALSDV